MSQRKLFFVSLLVLLCVAVILAVRAPRAVANITLESFTATTLNGQPEVYIAWETGTEIGTAGFYVQRSLTNTDSSFVTVSPFQIAQGDSLTGASYDWTDITTTLNTKYYYRLLEVLNAGNPISYDPVMVIAGVATTPTPTTTATPTATQIGSTAPTNTFTPQPTATTSTPTRTSTPRPTATPTVTSASVTVKQVTATRSVVSDNGATITPQPAVNNVAAAPTSSSNPDAGRVNAQAASTIAAPSTSVPPDNSSPAVSQPANLVPTIDSPVPSNQIAVVSPVPQLAPTQASLNGEQPVVVVTETAPTAQPAESRTGSILLIIGAAIVLLGGAFFLFRQVSK